MAHIWLLLLNILLNFKSIISEANGVVDIDGNWGDWGAWSECSVTFDCERGGIRKRSKGCDNPLPQSYGADCEGDDSEAEKCEGQLLGQPGDCEFEVWPAWDPDIHATKVAGQGDPAALAVGDWFTYLLDMDLPSIATDKKVKVEICTNHPDNGDDESSEPGRTSLAIGNTSVTAIGKHFESIWWQDTASWLDVGGGQMEWLQYEFDFVNSNQSDGIGNRINVDYDVIFSNVMNNLYGNQAYYISSGVAVYNDQDEIEYAWVTQEEVISSVTAAEETSYDLLVTSNIEGQGTTRWINSEQTFGLVITITNTNPMTNLEFDISEMLGQTDALHFGKPDIQFGAAYQFSDTKAMPKGRLIHLPEISSSSGLSIPRRRWRILGLLNTEATRDWENADNEITVTVPLTVVREKKDAEDPNYIYSKGTIHKFSVTVTAFQDDVFYPMEVISPNEVVVFEGDIGRGEFEPNDVSTKEIQVFDAYKKSMGPTWVGSSVVFIALVTLPPGKSGFNIKLSCEDPLVADHFSSVIVEEEVVGGPIGRVFPLWKRRLYEAQQAVTYYRVMDNFGAADAIVPVAAVITAVKEGSTTCDLRIGEQAGIPFGQNTKLNVTVVPLVDGDGTAIFSQIDISPVYSSQVDVYAADSVALELEVTVPPWSGQEEISFTFQPLPVSANGEPHFWRVCKVEIVDVSDDLPCMGQGLAEYGGEAVSSYTKSNLSNYQQWFEDVADIHVAKTCPSQVYAKGLNKFKARAFFENLKGQDNFFEAHQSDSVLSTLMATASFSNGSTWAAEFNFAAYRVELDTYLNPDSWLSCLNNEWYPLPSGTMVCHVSAYKFYGKRKTTCESAGGFLAEITTRDDAQTLLYILHKLSVANKKSSGRIALGAKAQDGLWIWENSGKEVELGLGEILKPETKEIDIFPYPDYFLYLKLYNQPDSSSLFMNDTTYFDLFVQTGGDAEEEFLCMKKGDGSTANAPTLYMEPIEAAKLEMKMMDIAQIKLDLKIPHGRQSFVKIKFQPDASLKVCKVKLTHIGSHYPCMTDPATGWIGQQNNTALVYESAWKEEGKYVELTLGNVRNYGSGPYLNDHTLDPDTIQISAFVTGVTEDSSSALVYEYTMASHEDGNSNKQISKTAGEFTIFREQNFGTEFDGDIEITATPEGGLDLIKGHCKRIVFSYKFPKNSRYYTTHLVENLGFDSGNYVTWCGMMVKKVGENFPCATPAAVGWSPLPAHDPVDYYGYGRHDVENIDWEKSVKYDATNTSEFYRAATNTLTLQHYPVVNSQEENKVYIEVSVRADKLAAAETQIPIEFTTILNNNNGPRQSFTTKLTLTVKELTDSNINETTYTKAMKERDSFAGGLPDIKTYEEAMCAPCECTLCQITGSVREHIWVPLAIGVPSDGIFPLKVFIEAPVEDDRAIFHLTTVRFPTTGCTDFDSCNIAWNGQGDVNQAADNILGVNSWVDLERTYDLERIKSDRIKTHMQVDQIYVDFGLITNAGYSKHWENENSDIDSWFWIWVGVEITDHPATIHNSIHQLHTSVFVADQVVTKQLDITTTRDATFTDRKKTVRPFLDFNLTHLETSSIYKQNQVVQFSSIIRHSLKSFGEGYPAVFRIVLDQYTAFIVGANEVTTNYTGSSYPGGGVSVLVRDEEKREGSYVDVVFPDGILFPDTIELSFSVTVDPFSRRKKEYNDNLQSAIKVIAFGDASVHGTPPYPSANPIQMSSYEVVKINVQTLDCTEEIQFPNPALQIQSSFVMNWTEASQPANAISTNQSLGWYAPVRSGPYWLDNLWLQFDFLTIKRITKFTLSQPDLFRVPTKVRFDYSNSGSSFEIGEIKSISDGNKITFKNPLLTRFLRVVIVETNDVTENTKPVAINGLKIYGCTPETTLSEIVQEILTDEGTEKPPRGKGAEYSLPNTTISSEDVVNYRHFAVDVDNDIIYMCDINPYRPAGGSACWVSMNAGALWIEQPRYIHNIVGYSPQTGRMYFQDPSGKAFLSSTDGVRMEVLDPTNMPAVLNNIAYPFKPAINIPGYDIGNLDKQKIKFPGSTYEARYDGITTATGQSLARWSSCCGKPAI